MTTEVRRKMWENIRYRKNVLIFFLKKNISLINVFFSTRKHTFGSHEILIFFFNFQKY